MSDRHTVRRRAGLPTPLLPVIAVAMAVVVIGLPIGCQAGRRELPAVVQPGRIVSPTAGYDPAWSPDSSRIAYVEATYVKHEDFALLLDNDPGSPTARDEVRVWNLHTGTSARLKLANVQRGRGFFTCPAWLDDSSVAFLASHLGEALCQGDREDPPYDWRQIIRYRMLLTGVAVAGVQEGRGSWMLEAGPYPQLESLSDGELAVWRSEAHGKQRENAQHTVLVLDRDGSVVRTRELPVGRWRSSVGAIGTMRPHFPVLVRQRDDGRYCLSRVHDGIVEDIHSSTERVLAVFGSPDGRSLAFLEEHSPPLTRCYLRVMRADGGEPGTLADDAYGESRVAWSPDATRLAYTRSSDGHIVIADVPWGQWQEAAHRPTVDWLWETADSGAWGS